MKEHQEAWIVKHNLNKDWLSQATSNGFEIHHIDGDHSNNDPDNLVLIYGGDHKQLHNLKCFKAKVDGKWLTKEEVFATRITKGKIAYEKRLEGKLWREIGGIHLAKSYAMTHGMPWPVKVKLKRTNKSAVPKVGCFAIPKQYRGLPVI